MKKLAIMAAIAAIATGCATKSRCFDTKGMFVSDSGQLAVGYVHVDAVPEGVDSAVIHYSEDTALLSPSTKTHDVDIILTGTNSVGSAEGVVKAICDAFVAVAPSAAKASNLTALVATSFDGGAKLATAIGDAYVKIAGGGAQAATVMDVASKVYSSFTEGGGDASKATVKADTAANTVTVSDGSVCTTCTADGTCTTGACSDK